MKLALTESSAAGGQVAPSATLTIALIGLAIFTAVVVTTRWPLADLGIGVAVLGIVLQVRELRFPRPFWWAVAFILWCYLTSFSALSPELARDTTIDRLKVIVIFLVVINVLRTERQCRGYLLILLFCFMIYPARGALLNYFHGYTVFGRALWNQIYRNPNDLGAMSLLAMGVALALATSKGERSGVRWAAGGCAGALLAVILLTQSRGVFLGLVLGLGPTVLRRILRRRTWIVYALVATIIALNFLPDTVWVRFAGIAKLTSTATIAQADPEGSAAQRWELEKTGWRIFTDHPLSGVGLGCYAQANRLYSPELGARDTHNTYLNLAAELGLPGLILWLGLVGSVLLQVRRYRPVEDEGVVLYERLWLDRALKGYLIAGIFASYSGLTMFYLVLGTLWCAVSYSPSGQPLVGKLEGPRMRPA